MQQKPTESIRQRRGKRQNPKSTPTYNPPQLKKEKKNQKVEATILIFFFLAGTYILSSNYFKYGPTLFLGHEYRDVQYSAQEWNNKIQSASSSMSQPKTILLLGGPHRAGTTILWKLLSVHDEISNFGSTFETGADASEGILFQSIYPRFGVGTEHLQKMNSFQSSSSSSNTNKMMTGIGKYALAPEHFVHLIETDERVTSDNYAKLLNRFGYYWDLSKDVWMEKSPQNAVISRFLEALYNVPNGKKKNVTKFLFITRHPFATALATDALLGNGSVLFDTLLQNYFQIMTYMINDMKKLQNKPLLIKFEDLIANPKPILKKIFSWLKVQDYSNEVLNQISLYSDPNEKYRKKWCDYIHQDEKHSDWGKNVTNKYQGISDALKLDYDLKGWCDNK